MGADGSVLEQAPAGAALRAGGAGVGGVVAGERLEPAAERGALQEIGERLGGGQGRERVAAEDEVEAFAFEGNKVERKCLGGGSGGQAAIGLGGEDRVGGGEVTGGESVIAADLGRREGGVREETVEEGAGSGAGFAIDEADVAAGEVFDGADALGIAGGDDEAFFPFGEGEDGEVLAREVAAEIGEIEIAGGGVLEVGAGDVNFALMEPVESEL